MKKKEKSGCGASIIAFIVIMVIMGVLQAVWVPTIPNANDRIDMGNKLSTYSWIGAIVVSLIVFGVSHSSGSSSTKPVKYPKVTNFNWTNAEAKFREIHQVNKRVSCFLIESKGEETLARLCDTISFEASEYGYIVKIGFYIEDNGFAERHGSKNVPLAKDNHNGDVVRIVSRTGYLSNSQYVVDHLYCGLDVDVKLNCWGLGDLVVYTDIPGGISVTEVKEHYNRAT